MSRAANGTHARVEHDRQALVNAEEAYLEAQGWRRIQLGPVWLWARESSASPNGDGLKRLIIMHRSDAVYFQHLRGPG